MPKEEDRRVFPAAQSQQRDPNDLRGLSEASPDVGGSADLYAGFCYLGGRYAEADKQFKAMGNNLVGNGYFSLDQMKQMRNFVGPRRLPN